MPDDGQFRQEQGIFVPVRSPYHRDAEHDDNQLEVLMQMQRQHFWYRGRHRLLLSMTRDTLARYGGAAGGLQAIDMGGGCGGWLEYVQHHAPALFGDMALADSSLHALSLAGPIIGPNARRFQIDLLDLPWTDEWDVVYLLDVIEHIPDDVHALRQVGKSMKPGGLLFVTAPALRVFWTYNDDVVRHQRRYSRRDLRALAGQAGLRLLRAEYFMFLLSPVLLISRLLYHPARTATPEEVLAHFSRTHAVPPPRLNDLLAQVLAVEAGWIRFLSLPWGTSVLAVLQKEPAR